MNTHTTPSTATKAELLRRKCEYIRANLLERGGDDLLSPRLMNDIDDVTTELKRLLSPKDQGASEHFCMHPQCVDGSLVDDQDPGRNEPCPLCNKTKQSGLSDFVHSSPEERERLGTVVAKRAFQAQDDMRSLQVLCEWINKNPGIVDRVLAEQQPKTSEGELLPCPKCNSSAHQPRERDYVVCGNPQCPLSGVLMSRREWNTRIEQQQVPEKSE